MIKVLVLTAEKLTATDFYRTFGPYSRLEDIDVTFSSTLNWTILYPFDIVVLSRPHTEQLYDIVKYVKTCKKRLIIDVDDSHFSVPETNPYHKRLTSPEAISYYIKGLKLADVITCATEGVKEEILSYIPEAKIVVIENAVDEKLFDLKPKTHIRNKIILWRGGGSHTADLNAYKDSILRLIKEYPEYKWVFMGSSPPFINDLITEDRVAIYLYQDIMQYFETLMELKPEIMIVPLEDNQFNKCKSAISLFEGALSGASVLATNLPEFNEHGAALFNTPIELELMFCDLATDKDIRHFYYECHLDNIPKLSDTNKLRVGVLNDLMQLNPKF